MKSTFVLIFLPFLIFVFLLLINDSHILFYFRDRSNQFRRQYPGSGGPPGRDFPPRYNRSPGRYEMSPPPHNKRVRRDW